MTYIEQEWGFQNTALYTKTKAKDPRSPKLPSYCSVNPTSTLENRIPSNTPKTGMVLVKVQQGAREDGELSVG